MDDTAKNQFKWTFYRLAVQLNIIIMLVALSVIAFFLMPNPYRIAAIVVMLILAAVLTWNFREKYYAVKAWLEEHGSKSKNT
ncbi:MAG: hypothetical protein ABFC71_05635 [Methanoregula sp.]|jgi:uncharacterized membrane protein YqjE